MEYVIIEKRIYWGMCVIVGELSQVREIIERELQRAGFRLVRLLLFGSRARGESRSGSDWDFYVIVDRDVPFSEKRKVAAGIRQHLVREGFCTDLFIQSERVVEERRQNTGYLTYYVLKEGIEV